MNIIYRVPLIFAHLEGSKQGFGINSADKEKEKKKTHNVNIILKWVGLFLQSACARSLIPT